jgi:hypothetical protein
LNSIISAIDTGWMCLLVDERKIYVKSKMPSTPVKVTPT